MEAWDGIDKRHQQGLCPVKRGGSEKFESSLITEAYENIVKRLTSDE
jgi:hypothetical protein